jgi:hypothetical protein
MEEARKKKGHVLIGVYVLGPYYRARKIVDNDEGERRQRGERQNHKAPAKMPGGLALF